MPLVQCPDCRREVSDKAVCCPQCGNTRLPKRCPDCNSLIGQASVTCSNCGAPLTVPPAPGGAGSTLVANELFFRRMADYAKLSGVFWIVLAVVQILSCWGIIAGLWNIFAGISRLQMAGDILARKPGVPAAFESLAGLIIILVINLVLGGVIGIIFVGFDFYIRDQILKNREIFTGRSPATA